MRTANESSAASTATTSPNAPGTRPAGNKAPPPPAPGQSAPQHDEAAYLAQQAVDAKAAISRVLSDLGSDLTQAANPAHLMKRHPWLTLGASAVAAFAATAALVPSKEDQALSKLAKIERALNPAAYVKKKVEAAEDGEGSHEDAATDRKGGHRSFARTLLAELIKAVQPALLSMLTAGFTAKAAQPAPDDMPAPAADPTAMPPQQ